MINSQFQTPFSNDQLKEVKKLDLAAVLCAVAHDMETVPRDPFYLGDHVNCSKIRMPDFSVWTAASAPKHSLFSCPFDVESGLMNCNRKNWSEVRDDCCYCGYDHLFFITTVVLRWFKTS